MTRRPAPDVLVCTALYAGALPYVERYAAALRRAAAASNANVELLLALDGVDRNLRELEPLDDLPRQFLVAGGLDVAGVRSRLLRAAHEGKALLVVFTDADDMLEPTALAQHIAALETADFSYGDQIPIDRGDAVLQESFFAGLSIPRRVHSPMTLLFRNFIGFTGAAVRREKLPEEALQVPAGVQAADWWFFTILLHRGLAGQQTEYPVVRYRLHGANTLGPVPDATLPAFRRRCEIALAHYRALPPSGPVTECIRAVTRLVQSVASDPATWQPKVAGACAVRGVWFDDVWRLAKAFLPANFSVEAA